MRQFAESYPDGIYETAVSQIPWAWWKLENANMMIHLRTTRLNSFWEAYWDS